MAGVLLAKAGRYSRLSADRAYDADALREWLNDSGIEVVILAQCNRTKPVPYNPRHYRERWRIEAAIGRPRDFRRIAIRYDKLARSFKDIVTLAAIIAFRI